MKKFALLLAVLMVFGGAPGWAFSPMATVDGVVDQTIKSDLRPVEDSGRILHATLDGAGKTYHAITDPMEPVLKPVRTGRDYILDHTKKILNTTWDVITLRHFRDSK